MRIRTIDSWLSGVVLAHLLMTFVHGAAHRSAQIGLGPAGMLFVLIVIEIAPLVGLVLSIAGRRIGGWIVASSMAASLLFGLINHFLLGGPDHVSSVAADSRALFTSSAILLVLSEAAGVLVGARSAARPQEEWS